MIKKLHNKYLHTLHYNLQNNTVASQTVINFSLSTFAFAFKRTTAKGGAFVLPLLLHWQKGLRLLITFAKFFYSFYSYICFCFFSKNCKGKSLYKNKNKNNLKKRISLLNTKPSTFSTGSPKIEPNNKNNNIWPKLLLMLVLFIFSILNLKYNLLYYSWLLLMDNLNLFYLILFYLWTFNIIFGIIYLSIGYFIIFIENEIKIDLNKIKIKFIRNKIESLLVIQKSSVDREKLKNFFLFPLFILFLVIIGTGLLIFI